jgi:K+/H+ antiporter YhaU regulatory subunit KhtT
MIREDGYRALRKAPDRTGKPLFNKYPVLSDIAVEACAITDRSHALGMTLEELRFRTKTGATIIAIERRNQVHTSPDPKSVFEAGDVVFLTGKRENINIALLYLTEGEI